MKKYDEIIESGMLWNISTFLGSNCAMIKLPDCGGCSVIWNDNEEGWEHVSVSPRHKYKIPTWDDMCILKDTFFGKDEEVYQIHPKEGVYVNIVENCLHLWKPKGIDLAELVAERQKTT